MKRITIEEVVKHNSPSDAWVIIRSRVYDVTNFIPQHPGGSKLIEQFAGKDASEDFTMFHPESILADNSTHVKLLGEIMEGPDSGNSSQQQAPASFTAPSPTTSSPTNGPAAVPTLTPSPTPPLSSVLSLYDMEEVARMKMRAQGFNYYITGATDEYTKHANQLAYRMLKLVPRVMRDVSRVDTSCKLLGTRSSSPLYISGAAKGGLAHPDGEVALSRACHSQGVVQMVPHLASRSLQEVAESRQQDQVHWLQLYAHKDRAKYVEKLVEIERLGYSVVCLTVDAVGFGKREQDLRTTPGGTAPRTKGQERLWADNLTWDDVALTRKHSNLKLVLKGIQCAEDAVLAYQHGVDGIIVSNHAGRNLDTARPTIEALVEVMAALRALNFDSSKFEVFVDGGIYRGTDIFKALAVGAKAVGLGKAALLGLAAYGQEGVERTIEILTEELEIAMQLMGTATIGDIKLEMIRGVENLMSRPAWEPVASLGREHMTPLFPSKL